MAHELLLLAGLHDDGNPGDEVGGLLAHLGRLVVQPPEDGAADLGQVRLHPLAQAVHDCAESVQHHHVLGGLFLRKKNKTVYNLCLYDTQLGQRGGTGKEREGTSRRP